MAVFESSKIRNICLMGHGGDGKTSLAEAMLFLAKATDRLGKTTEGNTVCDYDAEEKKRGISVSTALANIEWNDVKINILDTPGYFDFAGEVKQAVRVAGSAIIVVDGKGGVKVGAELAFDYAGKAPKVFFINKIDDENARYEKALQALHDSFGTKVCPVFVPVFEDGKQVGFYSLIKDEYYTFDAKGNRSVATAPASFDDKLANYKSMFFEALAETSDELMEKFFADEPFTREEITKALAEGMQFGSIYPVFCGSATNLTGVRELLDTIATSFSSPLSRGKELVVGENGELIKKPIEVDGDPSIFVFKTVADPFVGKMSYFKVMSGTLKKDTMLVNTTTGQTEKIARIYTARGNKQTDVDELKCGDIGITAKLVNTNTNDTLAATANGLRYAPIEFPTPYLALAIVPKTKGDEDKISGGIAKLLEEDYTIKYENNAETKQMLIYGLGETHVDIITSKLKNRYGTSVDLTEPRVAYRETIKKSVQVEGKHKKQSGGSGQYGHVKITFSHGEDDALTFTESVVGGSVPKGYFPAVEKGLLEAMQKGVLAGFPMVNLAADLFDGSYHPVDSNEISFKLAAKLAYKEGIPKAGPVILEPIGNLKVLIPDALTGDIIGDLNKRRGRILGMDQSEKKGYTVVEAEVPQSEMMTYTITLRAMSQGRGSYTFDFERYEEAPSTIAQKVIEEAKKLADNE